MSDLLRDVTLGVVQRPERRSPRGHEINPDCPAPYHNTANAARGIRMTAQSRREGKRGERHAKCICPAARKAFYEQAQRRLANDKRYKRELDQWQTRQVEVTLRDAEAEQLELARSVAGPPVKLSALADGACRTPEGVVIMDRYMDNANTVATTRIAQQLCRECTCRTECLIYALQGERSEGAWYGMYGGLGHTQRARLALRLAAVEPAP